MRKSTCQRKEEKRNTGMSSQERRTGEGLPERSKHALNRGKGMARASVDMGVSKEGVGEEGPRHARERALRINSTRGQSEESSTVGLGGGTG